MSSKLAAPSMFGVKAVRLPGLGYLSLTISVSVFVALLIVIGSPQAALGLAGAVLLGVLSFSPIPVVLWVMFLMSLLGVGLLQYFGRFNQALWLPAIFGGFLFFRALTEAIRGGRGWGYRRPSLPLPGFIWSFLGLILILVVSCIGNQIPVVQAIAGTKNYVLLWGLTIFLLNVTPHEHVFEKIWRSFLFVVLTQLPFTLYQHFFVASRRRAIGVHDAAWDSVLGTFGGDPEGGGASGALALVLVLGMTLVLALWRRRQLSSWSALIVLTSIIVTIGLAEIKVVIGLVPAAFVLLYRRELLRRPVFSLVSLIIIAAALSGVVILYDNIYWSSSPGNLGALEHLKRSFSNFFSPENMVLGTGEVGRIAGLSLWANDSRGSLIQVLFGYGVGASRLSAFAAGEVALRYFPYKIGSTSAATLLWDVGIVGAAFFVVTIFMAAARGARLSNHESIPLFHRCALEVSTVGLMLVLSMLPYNSDALYLPATGFLIVFMVGFVGYWHRRIVIPGDATASAL
ncbi:MAG: hypothetical protein A3G24_10345 [Betaproteobacteria bacterium RIFCSPLOWO2_12_FULL_62_13]|nr:MAG: hypothetical protein A3G24_10345 [Betaproteobacteria bacterium RIFCSPLOWO2_12_FULL_62_13]